MPIGEIGRRSAVVVVGTVRGTSVRLATIPGGKTAVFTDYDLRDISVWKGSVETRNLVLSVAGGSLHGRTLDVEGMPRFEEGRRYLLFLGENEPLCPCLGLTQGVFPLEETADGRLLVRRYAEDAVSGVAGGELLLGGAALRLEEFLAALDREGVRAPTALPAAGGDGR
jgi:hypothetical protein